MTPASGPEEEDTLLHGLRQLVLCGGGEVYVVDLDRTPGGRPARLWSWRAVDCPDISPERVPTFDSPDECKPLDGGDAILVTSSRKGVALIERATGRVPWQAQVPGAHSIERLPGGRVVVAGSLGADAPGLIEVFDLSVRDDALYVEDMPSGHGVVWDESRGVLWALAYAELRLYELAGWDSSAPALRLARSIPLPDPNGHDLFAVPGTDRMTVTTGKHVHVFDRGSGRFSVHPALGGLPSVKSVSCHAATGEIAYVQADPGRWWSTELRLAGETGAAPAASYRVTDTRLYKARWLTAEWGGSD